MVFNTREQYLEGFKIYQITRTLNTPHIHGRKDYYKIVLLNGDVEICSNESIIEASGTNLILANPNLLQRVLHRSRSNKGYACVFTDAFIDSREGMELVRNSPLVRTGYSPVIPLKEDQQAYLNHIFQKMLSVYNEDYIYKNELLRNGIEMMLHEALYSQPVEGLLSENNAAFRVTRLFKDLLERQFPIEAASAPLKIKAAQDFASALSIHVNYLNRSVKAVTGKPTTVHISERIIAEAKALLRYTDWSVADIAYSLGFEYPTYFNNFFKRITGEAPRSIRRNKV